MFVELGKFVIEQLLLPLSSIQESYFLTVGLNVRVLRSVLSFIILLEGIENTHRGRYELEEDCRQPIPNEGETHSRISYFGSEASGEEDHVYYGFGHVRVEKSEAGREVFDILSDSLIGVLDSTIDVADLIVLLVIDILLLEVLSEVFSHMEADGLHQVLDVGVQKAGREGDDCHFDDGESELPQVSRYDRLDQGSIDAGNEYGEEGPGHESHIHQHHFESEQREELGIAQLEQLVEVLESLETESGLVLLVENLDFFEGKVFVAGLDERLFELFIAIMSEKEDPNDQQTNRECSFFVGEDGKQESSELLLFFR